MELVSTLLILVVIIILVLIVVLFQTKGSARGIKIMITTASKTKIKD